MFEAMTLAMKMSEVLKTVDKNIQYLVRNEMVRKLSVVIGIQ